MNLTVDQSIKTQRASLKDFLETPFAKLADLLEPIIHQPQLMEEKIRAYGEHLKHYKYLYVLDENGVQLTNTLSAKGNNYEHVGRDRSSRPYMEGMFDQYDFRLSEAYISRNKKRPSLTAIQVIKNDNGKRIGFIGVDYDLRELPHTQTLYKESQNWRQMKGDPAIRGGLFQQERKQSKMDDQIENILPVLEELMLGHGIFSLKIHFSGSRSTIWHMDDPYTYRSLDIDLLNDPDVCLAYPRRPYFERNIVPADCIHQIFDVFKTLRFEDETIYLRSGSLNLVSGMVGLTFSCDGSHHIKFDEFLDKGLNFWFKG